jgi:uncharacterized protein (TIGR03435 family)
MQPIRIAAVLILLPVTLSAQPVAITRFEVAAIKPTPPERWGDPSGGISGNGRYSMHNRTLKDYIWRAYFVAPERVVGGPAWLDSDRFDIEAKADQPVGDDALMDMLRTLLEERFNLKIHREKRSGEALVLRVTKDGPKLARGNAGTPKYNNAHDHLEATNLPMSQLVRILSHDLKLPTVDETGLEGAFTFTLRWNPDRADAAGPDDAPAVLRSEISRAMAAQLGLVLEHRRTPLEVVVIDRADKPSAN